MGGIDGFFVWGGEVVVINFCSFGGMKRDGLFWNMGIENSQLWGRDYKSRPAHKEHPDQQEFYDGLPENANAAIEKRDDKSQ